MGKRTSPVLIGDLLVKSDMISLGQFSDAMPISMKTGLPIGRVLIASGAISEHEFKAAVSAQSLVRENLLPMAMAVKALGVVRSKHTNLDEALKILGWRSDYYEITNRLGDLLIGSGCLKQDSLDEALDACFTSGLPLGRVLVLRKMVDEFVTYAALTAQVLIREGHITREQAIEGLKQVSKKKVTLEESLLGNGLLAGGRRHTIRLGELLMLAEQVSEIDLLSAVERAMQDEIPIGQVLVRVGLISEGALDHALQLQEMVTTGRLKPLDAADILMKVRKKGLSLETALQDHSIDSTINKVYKLELPELLKAVGSIGPDNMRKAIDYCSATGCPFEEVVQTLELVDNSTLYAANFCLELFRNGEISEEQCTFAMQTWVATRHPIEKVLRKVGWESTSNW